MKLITFIYVYNSFHVSPATRKGKRLQLLQMLLLPFIPVVALVIQNILVVSYSFNSIRSLKIKINI